MIAVSRARAAGVCREIVSPVVNCCMRIAREKVVFGEARGDINLTSMRTNVGRRGVVATAAATASGPTHVSDCRNDDPTHTTAVRDGMSCDSIDSVVARLRAADAVLLRQSAISVLAEAVGGAGWAARRHLPDVLDLSASVLRMERGWGQECVAARRACSMLLLLLVKGLGAKLFDLVECSGQDFIGDVKKVAKLSMSDSDPVVAFHSSCAVQAINNLMRCRLFPDTSSPPPSLLSLSLRYNSEPLVQIIN